MSFLSSVQVDRLRFASVSIGISRTPGVPRTEPFLSCCLLSTDGSAVPSKTLLLLTFNRP